MHLHPHLLLIPHQLGLTLIPHKHLLIITCPLSLKISFLTCTPRGLPRSLHPLCSLSQVRHLRIRALVLDLWPCSAAQLPVLSIPISLHLHCPLFSLLLRPSIQCPPMSLSPRLCSHFTISMLPSLSQHQCVCPAVSSPGDGIW